MLPFLDEARVRALLRMEDLIPAMEQALVDLSAGRVAQPARQLLSVQPHGGYFGAMPAVSESAVGAKLVTFYPGNAARGLPTHLALIVLFRPETGEPLAMMDGRLITEMPTSAVSAVATRAMSAPDAKVLAILGSGVQARSHVEALRLVRDFEEIRVLEPHAGARRALRRRDRGARDERRGGRARCGRGGDRNVDQAGRAKGRLA